MPNGSRSSAVLALLPLALVTGAAAESTPRDSKNRADIVRGVVRALHQAAVTTDMPLRVAAVHVREGASFKAGQTVLEFDCRRQRAALAATEATELEMKLTLDKYRILQRNQSVGKNDLEVAEARHAKASAESESLRRTLDQCVVIAPFDGRLLEIALQTHETAQPGKPFLTLVSAADLEIDLIVPSEWAKWLKVGANLNFHIDELQRKAPAHVTRLGAAVDPISQTLKISAVFAVSSPGVLPGMSGTATFAPARE